MARQIQIGLAGLGFMAATHIKAIQQLDNVRIGALFNPSGRRLDGDFSDVSGNVGDGSPLKLDMAGVRTYTDLDAFLADADLDIIDICSPTPSHRSLAEASLHAGRNVLCEKPMARTSADARAMAKAAEENGKILMPAMCLRFFPDWQFIRNRVNDGLFGKPLSARFRRVGEAPSWGQGFFFDSEKSGGAILDLHIHDADFVQFCFGKPDSVSAQGFTKVSGGIDHVTAQYHYIDGPTVDAEGSWAMSSGFGFNMSYTVVFEHATVDYDLSRGDDAFKCHVADAAIEVPNHSQSDGYVEEIRHMVEAVLNKTKPTEVTPEDGISALELIEAEESAVQTGDRVSLST